MTDEQQLQQQQQGSHQWELVVRRGGMKYAHTWAKKTVILSKDPTPRLLLGREKEKDAPRVFATLSEYVLTIEPNSKANECDFIVMRRHGHANKADTEEKKIVLRALTETHHIEVTENIAAAIASVGQAEVKAAALDVLKNLEQQQQQQEEDRRLKKEAKEAKKAAGEEGGEEEEEGGDGSPVLIEKKEVEAEMEATKEKENDKNPQSPPHRAPPPLPPASTPTATNNDNTNSNSNVSPATTIANDNNNKNTPPQPPPPAVTSPPLDVSPAPPPVPPTSSSSSTPAAPPVIHAETPNEEKNWREMVGEQVAADFDGQNRRFVTHADIHRTFSSSSSKAKQQENVRLFVFSDSVAFGYIGHQGGLSPVPGGNNNNNNNNNHYSLEELISLLACKVAPSKKAKSFALVTPAGEITIGFKSENELEKTKTALQAAIADFMSACVGAASPPPVPKTSSAPSPSPPAAMSAPPPSSAPPVPTAAPPSAAAAPAKKTEEHISPPPPQQQQQQQPQKNQSSHLETKKDEQQAKEEEEFEDEIDLRSLVMGSGLEKIDQVLRSGKINVNDIDDSASTMLHLACEKGDFMVASMLLSFKADLAATDCRGHTPLHIAAKSSHANIVELLCTADKSCVNSIDFQGFSPLILAADVQDAAASEAMVRCLLENKAMTSVTTAFGSNALQFAAKRGHDNVIQMLIESDDFTSPTTDEHSEKLPPSSNSPPPPAAASTSKPSKGIKLFGKKGSSHSMETGNTSNNNNNNNNAQKSPVVAEGGGGGGKKEKDEYSQLMQGAVRKQNNKPIGKFTTDDLDDKETTATAAATSSSSSSAAKKAAADEWEAELREAEKEIKQNAALEAKQRLEERGQKLSKLQETIERNRNEAENFASIAHQLAERERKKKWWQL